MTNEIHHLQKIHTVNKKITMGNNSDAIVSDSGTLTLLTKNENNYPVTLTLNNVFYVPKLSCNLISLTKAMDEGLTWIKKLLYINMI